MPVSPSYQYITIPNDGKTIYDILDKSNVRLKVLEDGRIVMCLIEPDMKHLRAEL
jgi:hypothetical protein